MISKKIEDAVNQQINEEFFSSYLYLSMAYYFEGIFLEGFANWFKAQWTEEMHHATKFAEFISDKDGKVVLKPVEQPMLTFDSIEAAFQKSYEHEQFITKCLYSLYDLSLAEKDYSLSTLLHWYISEQVEEEKSVQLILEKIKKLNNDQTGILELDEELGERALNLSSFF